MIFSILMRGHYEGSFSTDLVVSDKPKVIDSIDDLDESTDLKPFMFKSHPVTKYIEFSADKVYRKLWRKRESNGLENRLIDLDFEITSISGH